MSCIQKDNVNRSLSSELFSLWWDNRAGNSTGHNYVYTSHSRHKGKSVTVTLVWHGWVWVFVMSLWLSKWTFEVDWQISQLMECGESLIRSNRAQACPQATPSYSLLHAETVLYIINIICRKISHVLCIGKLGPGDKLYSQQHLNHNCLL